MSAEKIEAVSVLYIDKRMTHPVAFENRQNIAQAWFTLYRLPQPSIVAQSCRHPIADPEAVLVLVFAFVWRQHHALNDTNPRCKAKPFVSAPSHRPR